MGGIEVITVVVEGWEVVWFGIYVKGIGYRMFWIGEGGLRRILDVWFNKEL